ncbi:MAG: hypothetical protein U5L96_14925 [Owenweeksia sp.]|nr:hypothetical protein [Owenweeksia sp.]
MELIRKLGGDIETRMVDSRLGDYSRYFKLLEKAKNMEGYQTRLEYDLEIE